MANTLYHQLLDLPYRNFDPVRGLSRLSSDVSYEDKALIKDVCPKKGVIMQITQIFIARLCNQLRSENITSYTPANEQRFIDIVNSITDFNRPPTPEPPREDPIPDVRVRNPRTRRTATGSILQRDEPKENANRKTRKGKGTVKPTSLG